MIINNNPEYWYENCKRVKMYCSKCKNNSEHYVIGFLKSFYFGLIFVPNKYKIGKKGYGLMCPICHNVSKMISKEEMKALKNN